MRIHRASKPPSAVGKAHAASRTENGNHSNANTGRNGEKAPSEITIRAAPNTAATRITSSPLISGRLRTIPGISRRF